MNFTSLPIQAQNFIYFQHSVSLKVWILFLILLLSVSYIFVFKKYFEKPTPYFSVAVLRIFLTALSTVHLVVVPLFVFFMDPFFPFWDLFGIYFGFYSMILVLYGFLTAIDFFVYGWQVMLKLGGIKIDDPRANEIYQRWFGRGRR